MVDQDLSGDDLKLVRYKILYTKRDFEGILDHGEKLVNWSTTLCDFGGYITIQAIKEKPADFKGKDPEYIQTFVEVLARYPKQEKQYDKRQVEVLEEIKNALYAKPTV